MCTGDAGPEQSLVLFIHMVKVCVLFIRKVLEIFYVLLTMLIM